MSDLVNQGFILSWTVEHYPFYLKFRLESPPFCVEFFESTSWELRVCSKKFNKLMLTLKRRDDDNGPDTIKLFYLFAANEAQYERKNLIEYTFEKGSESKPRLLIFPDDGFLERTFTISCLILQQKDTESGFQHFAQTVVRTEEIQFLAFIKNFDDSWEDHEESMIIPKKEYSSRFYMSLVLNSIGNRDSDISVQIVPYNLGDWRAFSCFISDISDFEVKNVGVIKYKIDQLRNCEECFVPLTISKRSRIGNATKFLPCCLPLFFHFYVLRGIESSEISDSELTRTGGSSEKLKCVVSFDYAECYRILKSYGMTTDEADIIHEAASQRKLLIPMSDPRSLCDVTLITLDECFPVHSVIVCEKSSYLRDLILCENEGKTNIKRFIDLSGIESKILHMVLIHIYDEPVTISDWRTARLLFQEAEKFQLPDLMQLCRNFVSENTPECLKNFIKNYTEARRT